MSRTLCLRLLLLAILSLLATIPLFANWQHLPAGEPAISLLAMDSTNQRLFISSAGVWRTENHGDTWIPLNAALAPARCTGISDVQIVNAFGDTIIATVSLLGYHATGERVRKWSTDGGSTWQPISGPHDYVVAWRARHNIWFDFSSWFRRSTDYGQTWADSSRGTWDGGGTLYQDPLHDSTLYVISRYTWRQDSTMVYQDDGGIERSTDLGATWTNILPLHVILGITESADYANLHNFVRLSDGRLFVSVYYGRYIGIAWRDSTVSLISADEGVTWVSMNALPDGRILNKVLQHPTISSRLYSLTGGEAFRSDDSGVTWAVCTDNIPQAPGYVSDISVNPGTGALYASTYYGRLYESSNGGASWNEISPPPVGGERGSFDVLSEAVFMTANNSVILFPDRSSYQLEVPFEEWSLLTYPPYDSDTTTDFGPVLYKRGDTLICLTYSHVPDAQLLLHFSRMAKSFDNGLTWNYSSILTFPMHPFYTSVRQTDFLPRIVAGVIHTEPMWEIDTFAYSDDLGETWTLFGPLPLSGIQNWIIAQHADTIYVMPMAFYGGGARLYRTTDLGQSWQDTGLPQHSGHGYSSFVTTGSEVFLKDGQEHVLLNYREGTWHSMGTLPFGPTYSSYYPGELAVVPGNPPILFAVQVDSNATWVSVDRGITWEVRDYELPYEHQNAHLTNLTYDPYRNRIWVSAGIGVCYLDANELSADGPLQFKPADYTLLSVYPNPFNSETKIRFDLLKREQVSVQVYDVQGRLVKTLVDEVREAGRHEISLALPDAASGVYFVRLTTATMKQTEKMVLLR